MLEKRTLAGAVMLAGAMLRTVAPGQALPVPAEPPAVTVEFPLEQVRAGMRGVAYTVFEGVAPEAMEVEILGRLKNALGPGRDMILARLHGPKAEYTGVVAGMSGSPVYVDGKLLGALSYRIGQFSKEPIAGITPIGQMLEVSAAGSTMKAGPAGGPEVRPIESPLVFGGFSQDAVTRFGKPFEAMGLVPSAGAGGMDAEKRQPEALVPGSAVSAVLVEGDLSVTGTCTVSYVSATKLLACGHPITQAGDIDVPMAKAEVLATLASPQNSFKIVNATEVVGAFTEDRSSAIFGNIGGHAAMIPVSVNLRQEGQSGAGKTMHVQVANHRELTPQLMMVSVYQCLQQVLSGSAETSYKVSGEIRLSERRADGSAGAALPSVKVDGWQSTSGFNPGAVNAALSLGERFARLFANPEEQPLMTGVDLRVESSDRQRTATLDAARVSTPEARAGETVEIEAVLRPYQRGEQVLRTKVTLPKTLEAGPVRMLISDGASVDRLLDAPSGRALGLADTVSRLNATHANNRVYVTLLDHAAQAVTDATALNDVPLSMANVLEPLKAAQRMRLTGESAAELGSIAADDAVSGSQVITLMVR